MEFEGRISGLHADYLFTIFLSGGKAGLSFGTSRTSTASTIGIQQTSSSKLIVKRPLTFMQKYLRQLARTCFILLHLVKAHSRNPN